MGELKYVLNKTVERKEAFDQYEFNLQKAKEVNKYHQIFEQYNETELHKLECMADYLGLKNIIVKDESTRFNLNAFKILGASYAIGRKLMNKIEEDMNNVTLDMLTAENTSKKIGEIILSATTDGNHGKGVAWTGKQLGYQSKIYMPVGTTENRKNAIVEYTDEVTITDMNYDDTVRYTTKLSKENNWEIIQDTAWEGYTDIPVWIMQGYLTVAYEIHNQIGKNKPTHIFLQAGVGAFAAVISDFFKQLFEDVKIIIVEPDNANCFYQSAKNGKKTDIPGVLTTIMAGLACGEPNPIGWEILKDCGDCFISVPDYISANGMRMYANPLGNDRRITSGESGAVGLGLLQKIMKYDEYKELREKLELDSNSTVLMINSEGDTDKDVYRDIVWFGGHSQN